MAALGAAAVHARTAVAASRRAANHEAALVKPGSFTGGPPKKRRDETLFA